MNCPVCGYHNVYHIQNTIRHTEDTYYRCERCKQEFTATDAIERLIIMVFDLSERLQQLEREVQYGR